MTVYEKYEKCIFKGNIKSDYDIITSFVFWTCNIFRAKF